VPARAGNLVHALLADQPKLAGKFIADETDALRSFLPSIAHDFQKDHLCLASASRADQRGVVYSFLGWAYAKKPATARLVLKSKWRLNFRRERGDWRIVGFDNLGGSVGPLKGELDCETR